MSEQVEQSQTEPKKQGRWTKEKNVTVVDGFVVVKDQIKYMLHNYRKCLKEGTLPKVKSEKTLKKYEEESTWRSFRTFKMSFEDAIEAVIKGEAEGVQAAFNLYKPRCEKNDMFYFTDTKLHLKLAYEMLYKRIMTHRNYNLAPFVLERYSKACENAYTTENVYGFVNKLKAEYKPYYNKKGKLIELDDHIQNSVKKLRTSFKTRTFKAIKSAGLLFMAAKYIKNCRELKLDLNEKEFLDMVKHVITFEENIVSVKKQKGIFNVIDLIQATDLLINPKVKTRAYYLYDTISKGYEPNEYRHVPTQNHKVAWNRFVKKMAQLKLMREKIDAGKRR